MKGGVKMKKQVGLLSVAIFLVLFAQNALADDSTSNLTSRTYQNTVFSFQADGPFSDGAMLAAAGKSEEDSEVNFEEDFNDEQQGETVADPLYYFNYFMYTLNDSLYYVVLKPVGTVYKTITPTCLRNGVRNFFHNLLFPVRFVNNLLQGKPGNAFRETGIFLVNTTIGAGGLVQVAQREFDIQTADEDLGQTFGAWGIGNGFYLYLPLLGPSSLRDALGKAGDYFITPINYAEPWELYWGLKGLDTVNAVSFRMDDYETLKKASLDPYTAIKNAYIENRKEKISQ